MAAGAMRRFRRALASARSPDAPAWQQAPLSERLAAPLVRAVLRRGNERAMERLAEQLAARRNGADGG